METSINTQLVIVISTKDNASGWHALPVDLRKALIGLSKKLCVKITH